MSEPIEYFKACSRLVNSISKDFLSRKPKEYIDDVLGYNFILYYGFSSLRISVDDENETPVLTMFNVDHITCNPEVFHEPRWCLPNIVNSGVQCGFVKKIDHRFDSDDELREHENDFSAKLFSDTLTEEEFFQYSTVLKLNTLEYYLEWNKTIMQDNTNEKVVWHWYYGDFISKEAIDELSKRI